MKKKLKKILRKIHLWLGLASGIVVLIMAITGAIYVFSYEIKSILHKENETIKVPINKQRVSLTKMVEKASAQFNDKYQFQNISIPNFPNRTVSISFIERDNNAFGYWNYIKFNKTVHFNPYTGEIVHIENSKWEFFNVVLSIHMTLFLGYNDVSHYIVVWSMYVFIIMLITGLILWWPKKIKQKQKFWFRWKKSSNRKRKNYDLHQILGFYTSFIALLIALTGLMWASKSFNTSVKWIANGGKNIPYKEISKAKKITTVEKPLDEILKSVETNIPESKYILIRRHPKPSIPYIARSYVNESLNYTRVEMYYDKKTAELLDVKQFEDKNKGEKLQTLNYDLHVGSIGGITTKILFFIISVFIGSLPVTGFFIWWKRGSKLSTITKS